MMKNITKLLLAIVTLIPFSNVSAQCPYDNNQYLTGAAPTTVGATIYGPQTWGGDFNRVTNMQAGYTYEISTCNSPTFDSELTIYPAGGGTAVAHDDDGCGTVGGPSKITFIPAVTGDYDILLDEYGCNNNSIDMEMAIKLVATPGGNPGAVNIPVVVHVVYKNQTENVSLSQIQSQIDALNNDYRKLNPDFNNVPGVFQPLGSDMNITFCLASLDPNGNPTNGITRTSTTIQAFSQLTDPKSTANGGHDNWDPTKYLNLWVCDLDGGLLGFATFPSDLSSAPNLDGVVIDYAYFGTTGTATAPFNLGRTATHEVGHWLNLRHIWGDAQCGDDFVNDTPTQAQSNTGCPNFPNVTCGNGPNGDLFYDFMDYTDDACMMMFTQGQKGRSDATLATIRTGLATSNGCGTASGVTEHDNQVSFELVPNPATGSTSITVNGAGNATYKLQLFNITGQEVKEALQTVTINEKINLSLNGLEKGIYFVAVSNDVTHLTKKLVVQ